MGFVIRATGGRVILIHVAKQNGYESCLLFSPEERSVKNVSKENAHGMQDDLISKKAAIDAMAELQGRASTKAELKGISKAWKRIKELQPIQPEIVRCKDCEHGVLDDGFPHQYFCIFKGDEWNNADYFCGHAKRREVTT